MKICRPALLTALLASALCVSPASAQLSPAERAVQDVYVAFYGRPADPKGLEYWAGEYSKGGDISEILKPFAASVEANQLFGAMSSEGKISFIYRILFNRAPDGPGLTYWAGQLTSGAKSLENISLEILSGARDEDLDFIRNKLEVADQFTTTLSDRDLLDIYTVQADIFLARNWLAQVDNTAASRNAALDGLDTVLQKIDAAGRPGSLSGFLVTPENTGSSGAAAAKFISGNEVIKARARAAAESETSAVCFGVPDGYVPLANATVQLTDAFGDTSAAVLADRCGFFVSPEGSEQTVQLTINAPGYQTIQVAASAFNDPDADGLPDAVALIHNSSSYALGGLRLAGNQLFFTLTDSATNKAVLGLTPSQLTITNNAAPASIANFGYSGYVSGSNARVAMALDASGSMDWASSSLRPITIAGAAARLFVNRKSADDEVSITLFDHEVHYLDRQGLDGLISSYGFVFTDGGGVEQTVQAPEDGFTTNSLFLEQMIKLYDWTSDAWKGTDPFFNIRTRWSFLQGATAAYSAARTGVESLVDSTARRHVLLMTDGDDNSSWDTTPASLIALARQHNVTIHTVGAGTAINATPLIQIADGTGGSFNQVVDLSEIDNLSAAFDAIRTAITYNYAAELAAQPQTGELRLQVDVGETRLESAIQVD